MKTIPIGLVLSLLSTIACAAPLTLSQTASQTPVVGSVACNAGGFHTDNSYWRAYDLAPLNLPAPATIDAVQFGVENANANGVGTTQPVTVNVYTSAGAFPGGVRTLRASQTVNVPDQTLSILNVALTTPTIPLPANSIIVLELFTPDGRSPANNMFLVGSNASAESGPGYISAADCGISTPTSMAAVGFPNMHIILNASGTSGVTAPIPVPSLNTWLLGLLAMVLVLLGMRGLANRNRYPRPRL